MSKVYLLRLMLTYKFYSNYDKAVMDLIYRQIKNDKFNWNNWDVWNFEYINNK